MATYSGRRSSNYRTLDPSFVPSSFVTSLHPAPSHLTPSFSSASQCTVKVENLAKSTNENDLVERLEEFTFVSVKVLECPKAQVNYAYLNCTDSATAQSVAEKINGKMLLHNNLLEAKIKTQGHQSWGNSSSIVRPSKHKRKDICAVKVLVQDFHLTGADLDDHFRQYGELAHQTIVRQGNPIYAFVNFAEPSAAQEARSNSTHTINGRSVIAVPFPTSKNAPPTNPTQDLVSLDFPCDPLVVEKANKELMQYFKNQQMMKIVPKSDKFTVHIQGGIAELDKKQIQSTITTLESNLESKALRLESHFLPMLADQETHKLIHGIRLPFEITILWGTERVELGELDTDFSARGNGPLAEATLKRYLTASPGAVAGSATKYHWYWFDDFTFQPYTERISEQIERKFKRKKTLQEDIGKYTYIIDTARMTQSNETTCRERKIERRPVRSTSEVQHITLYIRAHKDHTPELQREVKEIISKMIREAKIPLPDITTQAKPFTDFLLETAKRNFVKAALEEDGIATVILRGKEIQVKSMEVELQTAILKKEREVEKFTRPSLPSHWEPQVAKCELKSVSRGSSEWKDIQDKMHRTDFKPEITKIERIQNPWLWESYQTSLKRMSDKNDGNVNEKMLFHGPRQTRPKDIYDSEQGFDHRLAFTGLWGEGTYFAVESNYSDRYAYQQSIRRKQLFLAKVITGISCKYSTEDRTLKAPPKKSEHKTGASRITIAAKFEGERYDSVTANTKGSQIYVIYELGRVYPAYLITYTMHTYDF